MNLKDNMLGIHPDDNIMYLGQALKELVSLKSLKLVLDSRIGLF